MKTVHTMSDEWHTHGLARGRNEQLDGLDADELHSLFFVSFSFSLPLPLYDLQITSMSYVLLFFPFSSLPFSPSLFRLVCFFDC